MVLTLKDWGVANLRRTHQALAGKKVLARGTFTAVFSGSTPDRVLKLTVDNANYAYMTDGVSPDGAHKPVLHEDFGEVGKTSDGLPIYLIEVERLVPLPRSCEGRRVAGRVIQFYVDNGNKELPSDPKEVKGLSDSFARFLAQVNWFSQNYPCTIDCRVGNNFMQREDGTIVVSDPVFDKKLLQRSLRGEPVALWH